MELNLIQKQKLDDALNSCRLQEQVVVNLEKTVDHQKIQIESLLPFQTRVQQLEFVETEVVLLQEQVNIQIFLNFLI